MTDGACLVIDSGGISNSGRFIPAKSSVFFTGASSKTFITSSTPFAFHNVTINKTANDVALGSDISVTGLLQMVKGNLQLNNFNLDLGIDAGSIAGEKSTSHVIGNITIKANLNNPLAVNPGNIGIQITSASNLGLTQIKRGHTQQISAKGGKGINRYYDVTPASNTALNATVKFYYLDDELAGINKNELVMYESSDAGSTWARLGKNDSDIVHDWVLKTGIGSLKRFTLGSAIHNALPLTLLYFKGQSAGTQNILYWSIQNQPDEGYFIVERSANGYLFNSVATMSGKAGAAGKQDYQYTDMHPLNGDNYYRLKIIDKNTSFSYSNIIALNANNISTSVKLYPNPTHNIVNISFYYNKEQDCTVNCFDANGKVTGHKLVHVHAGANNISVDISSYANGIYTIKLENMPVAALKVVKQ